MSKKDFPKEITENNIQLLVEKAERIEKKTLQSRYVIPFSFLLAISVVLVLYGALFLVLWLLQNQYLDFMLLFSPWHIHLFFVFLFTVMLLISMPTIIFLVLSTNWLRRKYFGYPTHEELIFARCFIIAKLLMNNERMEAKKEVSQFLAHLTGFVRDLFNSKRKVYRPEFDLLRSGKTEFCRMLIFSREGTSELLMNFGLAFVRDDNPEAFSNLKRIVEKVEEYGEPKGRFRRFIGMLEQYPHSIELILAIIIFIISLLFTILGYRPPTP